MKNYFLVLLLITAATFTSCSDDDDSNSDDVTTDDVMTDDVMTDDDGGTLEVTGEIVIGDETLTVDTAFADDYNLGTQNEGFYNVDFILTGTTAEEEEFQFYVETFTTGTSFNEGTFVYNDAADLTEAPDQFFNNVITEISTLTIGDTDYTATEGSITITGTQPNYTLEFDVATEDGTVITGSINGEFLYTFFEPESGRTITKK